MSTPLLGISTAKPWKRLVKYGPEYPRNDAHYMRICMRLARRAREMDEVPVGAIVVHKGRIIGAAFNQRECAKSPTAHAEILAIEQAAEHMVSWRLTECTLYVTLEPCPMCAGAIINARVPRVVYGASDPKAGAMGSMYNLGEGRLNHTPAVKSGVYAKPCGEMLRDYFRRRRQMEKAEKERKKNGS